MKKYLYLLSIILFLSCNSKSTNEESMEKLSIEQFFKIDTLGTFEDEFLFAKEFLVYSDSILITLNKAHKDGYFIEFYNYINKRHISKLFKYGNGPNEMLSARIHLNNNKLFVNDYIKAQVAVIDMDSIIYSNNYNIKIRGHKVLGLPSAVICNNKFILENPYYFECEKLGIKQGDSRFIVTDGEKPYEYDRIYSYNTRNVNVDGCIITNDEKKRIMYAPMHNSKIELYDYELNTIGTFNELHYLETEYSIKGSEDSHETEIIFKNDIPFAYLDYTTDADFVYLVYMGNLLKKNTDMKDYPNWIVKFDWNCNLVEKYYINVYVLSISKSAKDNILYITVLNNEENPMLLKLQKTKL